METSMRKSSVIQERISLVSTHMYKQFLDYQNANMNTNEVFQKMINDLKTITESLKESFAARGVSTQGISLEVDVQKTIVVLNIFWRQLSFTTRCNFQPQALFRENDLPIPSGRIMAVTGNYYDLIKDKKNDDFGCLLDAEIASLFIPADKTQNTIIKIKHLSNIEFYLNQMDASREFALKVVETVCGGGLYHEEGTRKSFNI
jgi:hypothetical protein